MKVKLKSEQMNANTLYYTDKKNVLALGLDSESPKICLENNLLPYIKRVQDTIYEIYKGNLESPNRVKFEIPQMVSSQYIQ